MYLYKRAFLCQCEPPLGGVSTYFQVRHCQRYKRAFLCHCAPPLGRNGIKYKGCIIKMTPTTTENATVPWVEKYRPSDLNKIVLDPLNSAFLNNIISRQYFPNLLFYGPPGTGKTTTIMSLIAKYHETIGIQSRGLVLHLNASDDRGIDVIRNQINQFVNSRTLFENGMKFVILDEVDYMTKNAQYALRYLIQASYNIDVRFCLICNYISKIEQSLKNEFICIRFNQLPCEDIHSFLRMISDKEGLGLTDKVISLVQRRFQSDIRSMVNFLQTNRFDIAGDNIHIIDDETIECLIERVRCDPADFVGFREYMYNLTIKFNVDKKEIMKETFQYIIRRRCADAAQKKMQIEAPGGGVISADFLDFVETVMHFCGGDFCEFVDYFFRGLRLYLP